MTKSCEPPRSFFYLGATTVGARMPDDDFGKPYKSIPPAPRLPREMLEEAPGEPPSISVSPSMPVLDSEAPVTSTAPDNVYVGDVLPKKRAPVMAPKLDGSLGYAKYPSVAPAPVDLFPQGAKATPDDNTRLNQLEWQYNALKEEVDRLKKEIKELKNKTFLEKLIEAYRGKSNA